MAVSIDLKVCSAAHAHLFFADVTLSRLAFYEDQSFRNFEINTGEYNRSIVGSETRIESCHPCIAPGDGKL